MWLFIAVQTTQCNVALCHSTDNTMQCGSLSQYRQHNAMWLFITVQTTQCKVALHHSTDNTIKCGSSSQYRQHNAMWLFIAVQTTQCNVHVALHRCADNTLQCGPSSSYRQHNAMYPSINAQQHIFGAPIYIPMRCTYLSTQIIQCIVPPSPNLLESWSPPVPLHLRRQPDVK